MMILTPEYEPVQKLYLCFVHEFFNTRFRYGKAICEIIQAAHSYVNVELWIGHTEMADFEAESRRYPIPLDSVIINHDTPQRSILAEYLPIFAKEENGNDCGLIFENPFLDNSYELKQFSERLTSSLGFRPIDIGFPFTTAQLLVNEDIVLISDCLFKGDDLDAKLEFFIEQFPSQSFYIVPPLAGDITEDLDMFLWPIAPKVWIISEYPAHSPQAESIDPTLCVLKEHNHTIHRVPGLEPIVYTDVNTMPNYTNGVIINQAALVPAYQRKEDDIIAGILRDYGFRVFPIDCTQVILTNSGIHCISKTAPSRKVVN